VSSSFNKKGAKVHFTSKTPILGNYYSRFFSKNKFLVVKVKAKAVELYKHNKIIQNLNLFSFLYSKKKLIFYFNILLHYKNVKEPSQPKSLSC
jgi:hypothetical protein